VAAHWHTFGIRLRINNKLMENLNTNTIMLIKALDLELKELLLADLQAVRNKRAA
jgi:hypothetical protein